MKTSRPAHAVRRAVVVAAMGIAWRLACGASSDTPATEYEVKAAFIYKFLTFVEWPTQAFESADTPFLIGVVGSDKVAEELALVVANRNANGRPVKARRLQRGDKVADLHAMFIGRAENAKSAAQWIDAVKARPVLIVSESDDIFVQGSAINFVVIDDKVRFDVALRAAEQANLKISSRLLAVARKVTSSVS